MVMTYSHEKVQGQRSVGYEDRAETNGQTDRRTEAIALSTSLMRSVISVVGVFLITDTISVNTVRVQNQLDISLVHSLLTQVVLNAVIISICRRDVTFFWYSYSITYKY